MNSFGGVKDSLHHHVSESSFTWPRPLNEVHRPATVQDTLSRGRVPGRPACAVCMRHENPEANIDERKTPPLRKTRFVPYITQPQLIMIILSGAQVLAKSVIRSTIPLPSVKQLQFQRRGSHGLSRHVRGPPPAAARSFFFLLTTTNAESNTPGLQKQIGRAHV